MPLPAEVLACFDEVKSAVTSAQVAVELLFDAQCEDAQDKTLLDDLRKQLQLATDARNQALNETRDTKAKIEQSIALKMKAKTRVLEEKQAVLQKSHAIEVDSVSKRLFDSEAKAAKTSSTLNKLTAENNLVKKKLQVAEQRLQVADDCNSKAQNSEKTMHAAFQVELAQKHTEVIRLEEKLQDMELRYENTVDELRRKLELAQTKDRITMKPRSRSRTTRRAKLSARPPRRESVDLNPREEDDSDVSGVDPEWQDELQHFIDVNYIDQEAADALCACPLETQKRILNTGTNHEHPIITGSGNPSSSLMSILRHIASAEAPTGRSNAPKARLEARASLRKH
jgi:hypothetical protein